MVCVVYFVISNRLCYGMYNSLWCIVQLSHVVLYNKNLGSIACLWVQLSASLCGQLPVILCLCNAALDLQGLKPGRPLPVLGEEN